MNTGAAREVTLAFAELPPAKSEANTHAGGAGRLLRKRKGRQHTQAH